MQQDVRNYIRELNVLYPCPSLRCTFLGYILGMMAFPVTNLLSQNATSANFSLVELVFIWQNGLSSGFEAQYSEKEKNLCIHKVFLDQCAVV